jgi:hypothetical protein
MSDVDEGRLCLGGLQLPPKRRAQGIDADAQPVRCTADAARAAGNGYRIRIRMRLKLGGEGLKTCGIIVFP